MIVGIVYYALMKIEGKSVMHVVNNWLKKICLNVFLVKEEENESYKKGHTFLFCFPSIFVIRRSILFFFFEIQNVVNV